MANIAAFSLPVPGHIFPLLPILDVLRDRAHDVTLVLCTPGDVPRSINGIPVSRVAWPGAMEESDAETGLTFHRLLTPSYFAAYGESIAQSFGAVLEHDRPDFVLVDPALWGAMVALEASTVPWAAVAHNPLYFRALGVDPRGPGMPPPRSWPARVGRRILEQVIRFETSAHLQELNRVRARRALRPLRCVTDIYTSPPLILATTTEPFEYPRSDWPPGLAFIGPMICDPPAAEMSVEYDQSDPRPIVLISGSTIATGNSARHWADTVLGALPSDTYRVVTTLPADRVTTPNGDVRATDRLQSHSAILARASCVVCHGGAGTVHKALWYGVPVVAIPFALDRFEVAQRVAVAGAGVALSLNELTPATLRAAIRESLRRRDGAEIVKQQFRAAGGPRLAAKLIEARLAERIGPPASARHDTTAVRTPAPRTGMAPHTSRLGSDQSLAR